ncbi:MAG: helix-turn-helix domain-containing protein [Opitutales bacterium]|nr:helix-turn-helix domain-containing protein [Opitutales bacterium]
MRENIVRQTFRLILEKGLDAISISDIQKAASVSRALIYHYFSNKDELLIDAVKTYLLLRYRLNEDNSAKMTVMELIKHTIKVYHSIEKELLIDSGQNRIAMENYNGIFYQSLRRYSVIKEMFGEYFREFEHVIKNGQKSGEIRKDLSSQYIARLILYVFDGGTNYLPYAVKNYNFYADTKREMMNLYATIKA